MKKIFTFATLVLLFFNGYSAEHLTASFESTIGSESTTIKISIDTITDKSHFVITGPSNKYIGFGFGSSVMSGSYAFACNSSLGDVSERKFTGRNAGTALTPSVENVMRQENTETGIVTIEFDRDNTVDDSGDYFSFDLGDSEEINFIYSLGATKVFGQHPGGVNRSSSRMVFTGGVTGIDSHVSLTKVSLYPNPVSNVLTLDLGVSKISTEVVIMDTKGQAVLTKTFLATDELKLDVSSINKGYYVISIKREGLRAGLNFQKL